MRILVTGVGGFVGSHVVQRLVQNPTHHVVCVDSFQHNGDLGRLAHAVPIELRDRVTVLTHDLKTPLTARELHQVGLIDATVDVASRASVDESLMHPGDFIMNNIAVTVNTLEAARDVDCPLVVHVSTDEVYGPGVEPCSMTDHKPSSPYSASKAAQEDVCRAYRHAFNVHTTIVTSANMFGERQSQLAFIPKIVSAALNNRLVTVHTHNDVPGSRRYSYVGDVTDFIAQKIVNVRPNAWPERVALAGRYHIANDKLVEAVGEILGVEINYRYQDAGSTRPGYDHTYAEIPSPYSAFNDWDQRRGNEPLTFTQQLEATVDWFAANTEWLN